MHAIIAWFASVGEDVSLLTHEFLPEILLVSLLLLVYWLLRRRSRRHVRSTWS